MFNTIFIIALLALLIIVLRQRFEIETLKIVVTSVIQQLNNEQFKKPQSKKMEEDADERKSL